METQPKRSKEDDDEMSTIHSEGEDEQIILPNIPISTDPFVMALPDITGKVLRETQLEQFKKHQDWRRKRCIKTGKVYKEMTFEEYLKQTLEDEVECIEKDDIEDDDEDEDEDDEEDDDIDEEEENKKVIPEEKMADPLIDQLVATQGQQLRNFLENHTKSLQEAYSEQLEKQFEQDYPLYRQKHNDMIKRQEKKVIREITRLLKERNKIEEDKAAHQERVRELEHQQRQLKVDQKNFDTRFSNESEVAALSNIVDRVQAINVLTAKSATELIKHQQLLLKNVEAVLNLRHAGPVDMNNVLNESFKMLTDGINTVETQKQTIVKIDNDCKVIQEIIGPKKAGSNKNILSFKAVAERGK